MFYLRVSEAEGRLSLSATAHGRCACEGLTRVTTRQELNETHPPRPSRRGLDVLFVV